MYTGLGVSAPRPTRRAGVGMCEPVINCLACLSSIAGRDDFAAGFEFRAPSPPMRLMVAATSNETIQMDCLRAFMAGIYTPAAKSHAVFRAR